MEASYGSLFLSHGRSFPYVDLSATPAQPKPTMGKDADTTVPVLLGARPCVAGVAKIGDVEQLAAFPVPTCVASADKLETGGNQAPGALIQPLDDRWAEVFVDQDTVRRLVVPTGTQIARLICERAPQIQELRASVLPCPEDDLDLFRYLEAEQWNTSEARKLLLAARGHRQKFAEVLEDVHQGIWPEYVTRILELGVLRLWPHRTKDGGVIEIMASNADTKLIMDNATKEEVEKFFVYIVERSWIICDEATRREGRLIKAIFIYDCSKAGKIPDTRILSVFKSMGEILDAMYPDRLGALVLINVPWYFVWMFEFLKAFCSKKTRGVMHCTSGGLESYPVIYNNIAAESLPPELGGTAQERWCN